MILVTGANGLLGRFLTSRYVKDTIGYTKSELDVTNEDSVLSVLSRVRPEVVINCAGITRTENVDPYSVYLANTFAPRNLAYWCDELKIRFIQISTNCVFSGRRDGLYTEYEEPDAKDLYGRTKLQGEVYSWEYYNSLTVRTSFVGWPDPTGHGLLSWLKRQPVSVPVMGYKNCLWNGLTAHALSEYLMELAYSRVTGIVHLAGQLISKYELLKTVDSVYSWGHTILPVEYPSENKTLKSVRHIPYIPGTTNFEESCRSMFNRVNDYVVS